MTQQHSLFIIGGLPNNGKTTISQYFGRNLSYPVLHTDHIYIAWVKENLAALHYRAAKRDIRTHFKHLSDEQRRQWNECLVDKILAAISEAPNVVAEGWLLLNVPRDLRERLEKVAKNLVITMHRFTAHVQNLTFSPKGRDYAQVVANLVQLMQNEETLPEVG